MNTLSKLPTLFALPMLVACHMGDAEAKPTDAAPSKITKTQPFHSVEISGGFEVQLETGDQHSIEVIGAPDAISTVKIEVAGGELSVSRETSFWRNSSVQLRIVSPSVDAIELSGAVSLRAPKLQAQALKIEASGASSLVLSGAVDQLTLDLSGASTVDALGLLADKVHLEASGACKVKVHAASSLKVDVSGASSVHYAGTPKDLEVETSGASSIEKL